MNSVTTLMASHNTAGKLRGTCGKVDHPCGAGVHTIGNAGMALGHNHGNNQQPTTIIQTNTAQNQGNVHHHQHITNTLVCKRELGECWCPKCLPTIIQYVCFVSTQV
jgi:hypothetical protein